MDRTSRNRYRNSGGIMFKIMRVSSIVLMFAAVLVGIYGFCFEQWEVFPLTFGIPFCMLAIFSWIMEEAER